MGAEPRLSVWCIEEKGPAKKEGGWIAPPSRFRLKDHETLLVYAGLVLGLSEGGWIAPRFRLKDHETLLVYAGLVLGLSTHIF